MRAVSQDYLLRPTDRTPASAKNDATLLRKDGRKRTDNACCNRESVMSAPNQTRLNTNVPLVPPKPKLFLTATSIFMSRAVLAQ